MDSIDKQILEILQENSKTSNAKLAEQVGMAPSTTLERVRKLEEKGYIQRYTAVLDQEKLGYNMLVSILVTLAAHQKEALHKFVDYVVKLPEVLECYTVTGRFDYMLKVIVRDKNDLERIIREEIMQIPDVDRAETLVILKKHKETNAIKVFED